MHHGIEQFHPDNIYRKDIFEIRAPKVGLFGNARPAMKFAISDSRVSSEEYLQSYLLVRQLVNQWIDNEDKIYPIAKDDKNNTNGNSLVHNISRLNMKTLANPENYDTIVDIFQDTRFNLSFSRFLDLVNSIHRIVPTNVLKLIIGKTYMGVIQAAKDKGIANLPQEEDWYTFIDRFSFTWVLFIIQEIHMNITDPSQSPESF